MTLSLIHRGDPSAPLILSYYLAPVYVQQGVPASWSICYEATLLSAHRTIAEIERARQMSGARGPLVLVGYSAGCQAVRALLASGVVPDAVIALDGAANRWPPEDVLTRPWREAARRAESVDYLCAITCTEQTYVEGLGAGKAFCSTLRMASAVYLGLDAAATMLCGPGVFVRGCFRVEVHESATIDAAAHIREAREHGPRILRDVLTPWIEARGDAVPPTQPAPVSQRARTFGERVLEVARAELARGVAEDPPGSNDGERIRLYLAPCVRHGARLKLGPSKWCAAFASWCVWLAWARPLSLAAASVRGATEAWGPLGRRVPGPEGVDGPPIGYRAAVSELVADAKATGAWRDRTAAEVPSPGDLLVWDHHVGIAERNGDHLAAIAGNDGDRLARVQLGPSGEHPRCGPLLGWIRVG